MASFLNVSSDKEFLLMLFINVVLFPSISGELELELDVEVEVEVGVMIEVDEDKEDCESNS